MSKVVRTELDDLTYQIIGCAMEAHRTHGPGLRENTYQHALELRLNERNTPFAAQKLLPVRDAAYEDAVIGYYIPDFIVDEKVVVEIKALRSMDNSHIAQAIGYLAVTNCLVALLINFGARSLQWRRIFPPKHITEHKVNRQWLFVPDWLKAELASDGDQWPGQRIWGTD